ncbi:MAG: putative Sulfatase [Flaviaesturariibacter sp.]|nr:putative Sulfatase [Flaviaesturariibacter sp.]
MQKLSFLRRAPLHCFLIGLYIISFIYVRNMTQLGPMMVFRSALVSLLVSCLLFGGSYLVYRSSRKASIFTTIVIIGFFVYGSIYQYFDSLFYKGYWPFAHIHRFLILAYFILYLALFLFLARSRRPHFTVNYILNVFVLVLLFLNAAFAFLVAKRSDRAKQVTNAYIDQSVTYLGRAASGPRPDVYYIILDGFASEATIRREYGGQSTMLYDFLRKRNFYIADSSRSNYPVTKFSLSSSLNMSYLGNTDADQTNLLVRQNLVSYLFRQNGYNVVNLESGYAVTQHFDFATSTVKAGGLNEFERRLLELTILRIDDVLGIEDYNRTRSILQKVSDLVKAPGPKFGFVHIVSPHPPYVFDKNGGQRKRSSLSDRNWEPRKEYADQLEYISKEAIRFIDEILQNAKVPPVIILQSDHGPLFSDADWQNVFRSRMSILNAYYGPPELKTSLYKTISPVNSFRVVSRCLFGQNFPLLADTTIPFATFIAEPTFKLYLDAPPH